MFATRIQISKVLCGLAILGAAVAAPAPASSTVSSPPNQAFTVNYNFETVERLDPVLTTTEIQEYNLLYFTLDAIDTDPDNDGNHLGIAPHSYRNVAVFSANTQLLSPSPALITSNYTLSTITSFLPAQWYYGCVLPSEETAGSLPTNCTITATGVDSHGAVLATQEFVFKTNGSQVQDLNKGVFAPSFARGIYALELTVTNPLTTVAVIDDFIATLAQNGAAPFEQPASY